MKLVMCPSEGSLFEFSSLIGTFPINFFVSLKKENWILLWLLYMVVTYSGRPSISSSQCLRRVTGPRCSFSQYRAQLATWNPSCIFLLASF